MTNFSINKTFSMYGICGGEFEIKVFFFGFQMNRIDSKKIAEKKILHVFT